MRDHMSTKVAVVALAVALALCAFAQAKKPPAFYCKYCGHKASSVMSLTASLCIRHPSGPCKGRHVLYEGGEKEQYMCKHCGKKATSIATLTGSLCIRHPNGPCKGKHEPAL